MNLTRQERWLLLGTLVSTAWLCLVMPVFAQEAYYWSYAQFPDLSYFDHPPMVAWLIWLGTSVFGDGVVGLRLGTLVCSVGAGWIGLLWLRQLQMEPWIRSAWLVCSMAMPMLAVSHFLTTPDPPLVFFWTATVYALWRARDGGLGWWTLAGFAAGCSLLSKYAGAFLAVSGVLLLLADPAMRRQWLRPGPYLGVLVAAVTFLPVVVWNVSNDFESFRFQTEGRWSQAHLGWRWLGDYVGGQIGVVHPVIALLLPAACWWLGKRALQRDVPALWLLVLALPMPLFFLANSLFIQVKVNWLTPCFLPMAASVLWWWRGTELHLRRPKATKRLTWLVVGTALVVIVLLPIIRFVPQSSGSSWNGWDEIAARAEHWEEELDARDGKEGNVFFFASSYRDAAQLFRGLKIHMCVMPGDHKVEPVMAQNVFGETALQFDHWEPTANHVGQNAIYVLLRPDRRPLELQKLQQHFESIKKLERVTVERLGWTVAEADIYEAIGYRGPTRAQ